MMAMPRARQLARRIWCTSALAPTSMPRVGSSTISTLGSQRQPARQHDLLLVAAREVADRAGPGSAMRMFSALRIALDQRRPRALVDEARPARRSRSERGDREVGADRRAPGTAPAACGPPAPGRCRARIASRGERIATAWPSTRMRAGVERVGAEDGARELGAARRRPGRRCRGSRRARTSRSTSCEHDGVRVARVAAARRGPRPRAPTSPALRAGRGARTARSTSRPTIMRMMPSTSSLGDRAACRPACRRAAPSCGRRSASPPRAGG